MRYWWVNQNQTHQQEQGGGYLWSPVRKQNGARNPYYDFMREVAPGDLILCYFDGRVSAMGIALSYCFDAPKPAEFGNKGSYWEPWGHRIAARFLPCPVPVRPKEHLEFLRPLLPERHSPIHPVTGNGLQTIYLTTVSQELAEAVLGMCGLQTTELSAHRAALLRDTSEYDGASVTDAIEEGMAAQIRDAEGLSGTERQSVLLARVGQGEFRSQVLLLEKRCRVTRITDREHLVASHIKPWRSCQAASERLDGNNGLALAPHVDHLFDRGFLSFRGGGEILVSPLLREEVLSAFHIDPSQRVEAFRDAQLPYLDYHHGHVLHKAS